MYLSSRNIIFSIFLILIASMALQDGMFMDGQLYGIVAKNLAFGESSFWKPWLSDSYLKSGKPYFMEHPPFGFFLQSIAFKQFKYETNVANSINSIQLIDFSKKIKMRPNTGLRFGVMRKLPNCFH